MGTVVLPYMSEAVEPTLEDSLGWQNQFIADNLRRIFLLVYRMVGNVADAQDLTQEVFIKALQRQDQLKDAEKAAHWLSRIATNTAIDFIRRHNRLAFCDLDGLAEPVRTPVAQNPEQLLLRAERQALLEDGLQVLTPRERAALLLRDVEDLPAAEVARHLRCSKATVRSHIANARTKFRRYLAKRKS